MLRNFEPKAEKNSTLKGEGGTKSSKNLKKENTPGGEGGPRKSTYEPENLPKSTPNVPEIVRHEGGDAIPSTNKQSNSLVGAMDMVTEKKRGVVNKFDKFEMKEDFRVRDWDKDEDSLVRKVARNRIVRKWELLKLHKEIIEENEELASSLNVKESAKEGVVWDRLERKKFDEWKTRNLRYMSLKESAKKGNVKVGHFEKFCKEKGFERKKGLWEQEVEKEIEGYEKELKEISAERKVAKSKKRRLAIYRKSRERLPKLLEDWLDTPGKEEERKYKRLKEKAMKENIVEEIGRRKMKKKTEDDTSNEDIPDKSCQNANVRTCNVTLSNASNTEPAADLGCDNHPDVPYTTDCARMSQTLFTKPQQRQTESSAEADDVTSEPGRPTNQRGVLRTGLAVWPMGRGEGEETKGWAGREGKLPGNPNKLNL